MLLPLLSLGMQKNRDVGIVRKGCARLWRTADMPVLYYAFLLGMKIDLVGF
jgi:hypothetical protein